MTTVRQINPYNIYTLAFFQGHYPYRIGDKTYCLFEDCTCPEIKRSYSHYLDYTGS